MKKINLISYLVSAVAFFLVVYYLLKFSFSYALFLAFIVFLAPMLFVLIRAYIKHKAKG